MNPCRPGLLHYMRQLMGKQPPPLVRPRSEPTGPEHDVLAHRVGMGIHVPRRLFGGHIGMHPHPPKSWPKRGSIKARVAGSRG